MNELETTRRTAADLMSRDIQVIKVDQSLRDAAATLSRCGIHGAPVVDASGRCVGMFTVSDLASRMAGPTESRVRLPQTCSFQEKAREPGGREVVLCRLEKGVCPFQRLEELADRRLRIVCREPHCVPTDWQVVELDTLPTESVCDHMTTIVVTAAPDTPVSELARLMLEQRVQRLVILDSGGHPVGLVAASDLLETLTHSDTILGSTS